ncbi:hypothetical protein G7059_00105 [Erysipelothrix sp. HDW6A]|uniref:hypothetical protein n=1 Tax=Erysipelothrix sp. HDW6A TaxID=2714928 RepID=UPI0014076C1D|nr:hypothetical protein [Erysipelothrix sp. HDW6A]QIK56357.1 hypothetical protein G7059_00105 [Erysipelothrix sp. HDW6A]
MKKLKKAKDVFYIEQALSKRVNKPESRVDKSLEISREWMKNDGLLAFKDDSNLLLLQLGEENEPLLVSGDDAYSQFTFVKNIVKGYSSHHKMLVFSQKTINSFSTSKATVTSLGSYEPLIDGIHQFLNGKLQCLEIDVSDYRQIKHNDERTVFMLVSLLVGLKTNITGSRFLIVDSNIIDDSLMETLQSLIRTMREHNIIIVIYGTGDSLERFITSPLTQDIILTRTECKASLPHSLRMKFEKQAKMDLSKLKEDEVVYLNEDEMKILTYLKWEDENHVK